MLRLTNYLTFKIAFSFFTLSIASASRCVTPFSPLPLMERTRSPFCMRPSRSATLPPITLWICKSIIIFFLRSKLIFWKRKKKMYEIKVGGEKYKTKGNQAAWPRYTSSRGMTTTSSSYGMATFGGFRSFQIFSWSFLVIPKGEKKEEKKKENDRIIS